LEKQYATYHGILKNAVEGKVVTRFPPEPSGYLHIGHCKAALLNYHYAKIYKGHMIFRFDDTNPTKEKDEYVESILEDVKALGITWEKLSYTSDYFDYLLDKLRDMIARGLAYCDNTSVEEMRDQRTKKIESKCRNASVEDNLKIYDLIRKGDADDYCIRAKIDMQNNNGCLRDPVMARTSRTSHHRTGTKYVLYPTYDFACPMIDSYEGVTHVLRTNEYADRIPQYKWVLKAFDLPELEIYEYSRLNLEYTVLSKRKLTWFVDTGKVEGWDDPRFPTFRGCMRKGIRVETLTEFMLEQGPSKRANLMEWEKIWAINKRIIDPICPRYAAVSLNKASKIIVTNGPKEPEAITVMNNKLNAALGERPVWQSNELLVEFDDADQLVVVGEKITLMNWGNFQIHTKEIQPDGSYLITAEYLPEDKDFKKTKKITWLANNTNLLVANLYEFDQLIKTPKVEENDNFEDLVNVNSVFVNQIYIDSHVRTLSRGNDCYNFRSIFAN
jgi:glutamyl-tRNA synthetase